MVFRTTVFTLKKIIKVCVVNIPTLNIEMSDQEKNHASIFGPIIRPIIWSNNKIRTALHRTVGPHLCYD